MKKLFFNGIIRTMAEPETVEAVLIDGGTITAAGKYEDLLCIAGGALPFDLEGHTLLPAFIDAHSHFSSYAMSLLQVPLDDCRSFDEISAKIRAFIADNGIRPGTWVAAKGYDQNALREGRHPTLALVDSAAPANPLILQHVSGHMGVFNSPALRELGVTAESEAPEGGKIGRSGGRLTGFMEENAFIEYAKNVPMNGTEDMLAAYAKAQESFASHGIATVQEGMTVSQMLPLCYLLLRKKLLKLDLVAYAAPSDAPAFFAAFPDAVGKYSGHFKLGGYKIVLDGSPQGRTAWLREPYKNETPPRCGYGAMKDSEVAFAVEKAAKENMQLLAHCNGDAAAEQLLRVLESAKARPPRTVMIHAQLLGRDQLSRVKALGIIPSFFVAHVYHWGDAHISSFGLERASRISPALSALKEGIMFTFHQDAPVIEPDMLETVWCAVNRVTRAGVLLGSDERIPVPEALKAVTINAAYQYFEEDEKGSIEQGKVADFVVLDKDPLAVDPMDIRSIKVLATIKNGETIYGSYLQ